MKSYKQVSWSQFSEEGSMTSKDEESSSCSLTHNLMGNYNMIQEEECSMCGDVGLPQYLFKCVTCSHRYQHIYCSKFYPYRIEASICNWCLPMEQLAVNNIAEIDDNKDNININNSIIYTHRNTKPDIEAISNSLIDPPLQNFEKHTKAFEYLLQVAELHDQGHQLDNFGLATIEEDNCIIRKFSEKNYVGHDQINRICSFYQMGHGQQMNAKELNNQEPASLMVHQIIFGGCRDDHNRSFYRRRRGDKINYKRGPSSASKQLQYNHSQLHAYVGHDQTGKNLMNQLDVSHFQTIKKITNTQDLGHDQLLHKLTNQDLAQNQTTKKLNHQDQAQDLQTPAINPVGDHPIGCSDGNDKSFKWQDAAAASKRARLHRQLQAVAGGDHRNNPVDQQKIRSHAADYNVSSDDSDDQHAEKSCFALHNAGDSTGPAKRSRHRQSAPLIIAVDNDVVNPVVRQRAIADSNDLVNTADHHRVISIKQSSPTQHAWSRPAGKRDHLMTSPSRAINRRYKLLADVLC